MYRPNLLRRPALLALATMILAGLGAGAPGVATPARAASAILPGIANRTSEHRNGIGSTRELLAAFDAADPNDLARLLRPRFPRIL